MLCVAVPNACVLSGDVMICQPESAVAEKLVPPVILMPCSATEWAKKKRRS